MEQPVFRKESIERVSSPEQLSDYLHVTSPAIWVVLSAVILLLASLFVWSGVTAVESYAAGTAEVRGGVLTLRFDDADKAANVTEGMDVKVGGIVTPCPPARGRMENCLPSPRQICRTADTKPVWAIRTHRLLRCSLIEGGVRFA